MCKGPEAGEGVGGDVGPVLQVHERCREDFGFHCA